MLMKSLSTLAAAATLTITFPLACLLRNIYSKIRLEAVYCTKKKKKFPGLVDFFIHSTLFSSWLSQAYFSAMVARAIAKYFPLLTGFSSVYHSGLCD